MASRTPRWGRRLLIAGVVAVVCVGVAEGALRLILPTVISGEVRNAMNLPSEHPVDVSLRGSAVVAAVQGTVGNVTVRVPDAPLTAGITGEVTASARSLPFHVSAGKITDATASVSIATDQLSAVAELATRGVVDRASVAQGNLAVTHEISFWGIDIPLEAVLNLGIESGKLAVQPVSASVGDAQLTVEQIRSVTGSALDGLFTPHLVCLADQLPVGVTVTDLELSDTGGVVVTANLSETLLSDPTQQTYGRCDS